MEMQVKIDQKKISDLETQNERILLDQNNDQNLESQLVNERTNFAVNKIRIGRISAQIDGRFG